MKVSSEARRAVDLPAAHTIADGIAVRVPIPEAVEDMLGIVDVAGLAALEQHRRNLRANRLPRYCAAVT